MPFGLSEATIEKIQSVLKHHAQVEKAVLYGSRAKGTYKNGSDIDLTLIGGSDLDLSSLRKMMNEIDDLLLPYSLDLSIFPAITDRDLLEHITRVGVVFYEKRQK